MDGKGAWRDNVFVERVWKSVKYEEVYLKAYANVPEARSWIGTYLDFYNSRRPHQSLGRPANAGSGLLQKRCSQSRLRHNQGQKPLIKLPEPPL